MITAKNNDVNWLSKLDDSGITKQHWNILMISGMGFFTDAYDLFIIGVVVVLLRKQWHLDVIHNGIVESIAVLAAAVGGILFGRVADMLGRKRIYGYECLVLAGGAIASALSPNIVWLILFRFILGVGVGGDYPVSATIMGEYTGKRTRGMLVTLVFTMQAAGLIVGPLLASVLLISHMPTSLVWRILLAAGAIPAIFVYQARRRISETPRFLLAAGKNALSQRATESVLDEIGSYVPTGDEAVGHPEGLSSFGGGFATLITNKMWRLRLIGASMTWFLLNFAYLGNLISAPIVLSALEPKANVLHTMLLTLLIFTVAALPGYLAAAFTIDKLGRKTIQMLGFFMMAISFVAIGLIPDIQKLVIPFLIIYGTSYFFTEIGPNSTTFVYPNELFPVKLRTTGNGIAAAMGKIGAFIGALLFPFIMKKHGLATAELTAAFVCLLGLIVTLVLLPETKGKSLEELSITQ